MSNEIKSIYNMAIGRKFNLKDIDSVKETVKINRLIDPFLNNHKDLIIKGYNWNKRSSKLNISYDELFKFINELKDSNIEYLNLKGLSMTKYYEENKRDSNDFDFLVKNIDDFYKIDNILVKNGYTSFYFPMLTMYEGNIVGITRYHKKIGDFEVHFEINIGKFMIDDISWFGIDELWDTSQKYFFRNIELNIPNDNLNMIILLIEVSGRERIYIRDLVDFHFMITNGVINWDFVWSEINNLNDKHLVDTFVKVLADYNMLINNEPFSNTSVIQDIKREYRQIIPKIIIGENKFERLYYRYLIRIGNHVYSNEQSDLILKSIDNLISPRTRFELGFVTYFIPLSYVIKRDFKWIKYKKHDILLTKVGSYIATNFGLLEENEEVEIAEYLDDSVYNNEF